MRLLHVTTLRLSLLATFILVFWAVFFYYSIMDEFYDEVDDSLEDYAEIIITRSLSGQTLPQSSNGTNNYYYMREIPRDSANQVSHIRYEDKEIKLDYKNEIEPARVLTYIFMKDNGRYYELVVATPNIDKDDLRQNIAYWVSCLFVVLLICIVLVNLWGINSTMRPLKNILNWLDSYRLGQTKETFENPTQILEFQRLNEAVIAHMERSKELYEQQNVFIGNASHEMQTPIAACQNRIEMLLEEDGLSERLMEELIKVNRTLGQLSKLNKSLLMLCKIENGQFSEDHPLDFGERLRFLLPDYESVYHLKKIKTEIDIQAPFMMDMDATLADVLLSNLLKNAYVHNVPGGMVKVTVTKTALSIVNTGEKTALDEKHIFERFYHTAKKSSSSGLGLALVDVIRKRYQLEIRYRFADENHVFELFRKEI